MLPESNDVQNICDDDSSHIESNGTDEFNYNNHNNVSSHVTDDGIFQNLEESELSDPEQERPYTNADKFVIKRMSLSDERVHMLSYLSAFEFSYKKMFNV